MGGCLYSMNTEIVELPKLAWMNEKIQSVEHSNWLYKLCCFFLGKRKEKLTYEEMFLLLYGLNRNKLGDYKAKFQAMNQILKIYKYQNNKLPDGIEKK